jgi:hypothetical protein
MNNTLMKKLAFLLLFIVVQQSLFAEEVVQLTADEIKVVKTIASYFNAYNLGFSALALIAPILGFFSIKNLVGKWAEDKALEKIAQKLNIKVELLEGILKNLVKEDEFKKRNILILNATGQPNITVSTFLRNSGFSNFNYKCITNAIDLNGIQLLIFDYYDQDLATKALEYSHLLTQYNQNTKILVLGKGRIPDNITAALGSRLSIANGLDTLEQRIIGAYKTPA